MNFKNPQSKNGKKPPKDGLTDKIKAVINLLQLGGGMAMPKMNNKVISFLIFLVVYFFITGIGVTFYWLVKLIKYIL